MVKIASSLPALIALLATGSVIAHPHALPTAELAKRFEFQALARRSLGDCQSKLRARSDAVERAIARRQAFAEKARKARDLTTGRPFLRKRDVATVLNTSHQSSETNLTADSDPFDSSNVSCVLTPEVNTGPYFVAGELIRSNISEEQEGVPFYADIEVIDVSTCEPVSGYYVDVWHANATGVLSGIVSPGNGLGTVDPSNADTTFNRGIQETTDEGYAQFVSIFPGHYGGHTNYIQVLVHQTNGTVADDNSTYTSDTVVHSGQLYFDQDLIDQVEATSPYSTNTQAQTSNADDEYFTTLANETDPVMEYVLLGDDISDGILAWASVGIDTSAAYSFTPAATASLTGVASASASTSTSSSVTASDTASDAASASLASASASA